MNKHRSLSGYVATLGILLALAAPGIGCKKAPVQDRDIANDARALEQLSKGMEAYMSLHSRAEKNMPHIKASQSGAKIVQRQHNLAAKVQAARRNAKEGDIFTPDVIAYFRRQIDAAYLANGAGIQAGIQMTAPLGSQKITVNQPYPEDAPYTMVPPSLLLHLPSLPELVQYQIVNHDLIIRDVECNLVVDVMRNAIP
ncbi:MAG: hypothetical protein LAP21_12825 [Acidobacteriia bacterium]|nr:hypothetical protein [Terriglobia bacterium]